MRELVRRRTNWTIHTMAGSNISSANKGEWAKPAPVIPSHASNGISSEGAAQQTAHAAAVPPPTIPKFFRILFMRNSSSMVSKMTLPGM